MPLIMWLFALPAIIFRIPFDYVIRKIANSITARYWSWTFSSLPLIVWLKLRFGVNKIFTTGGPSCAHVAGMLAAK